MKQQMIIGLAVLTMLLTGFAEASVVVPMQLANGKKIGTVRVDDTSYGLLLTPALQGLSPGVHGFHVHQMPTCQHKGMAAGGHLDPGKTNAHRGPYSNGHLGDLPVLIVNGKGNATLPVLAPRLKLSDIEGHALMIHVGGDNYADKPEKLGGGGARMACGVVP